MPMNDPAIGAQSARPFLSGVVLAAGASTRMGRPKQLLPLGDRCLLERVVDEVARSQVGEVIVVLGHAAEAIRRRIRLPAGGAPCRVVVNGAHAQGQSGSLRLGLGAADPAALAAAIVLGDQPGVTHRLIDRVASAFLGGGLPAARPVYGGPGTPGRVPGHPVILARRLWRHLEGLRGDEGARTLLAPHPEWLLEVPIEGPPPADVDTWRDYEAHWRTLGPAAAAGGGRRALADGVSGRGIAGGERVE
jgi:molybdenum cofactor cytidylyltransferase